MALEYKILSILKPTIAIDAMVTLDTDDPNSPSPVVSTDTNLIKHAGGLYPLIEIKGYKFTGNEIISMRLEETGFTPQISVTIANIDGSFLSTAYPMSGDPISLFIRSKKAEFKPIRADFDITFVNSTPSTSSDGEKSIMIISGMLRVPELYSEHCKSFPSMMSTDALMGVCQELGLGYASNETNTNDKMTWLCPYDTYERFIKDVVSGAHSDLDNFYKCWIDKSYYLNFVNINSQFSEEFQVDKAIEKFHENNDYFRGNDIETFQMNLILTNHPTAEGTGNFITNYALLNDAGQVVYDNGYRRYLQFYDSFSGDVPKDKYQSFFIEPSSTPGTKDKLLLRGRIVNGVPEEGLSDSASFALNMYKWMGPQYGLPNGNCHESYLQSLIQNWQNNQEIDKLVLSVHVKQCNFNIIRGMRIPVVILNNGSTRRQKQTQDPSQDVNSQVSYDKFLSGYYYVSGLKYTWDTNDATFRQEILLSRREWPMPVQFPQNPNLPATNVTNNN